jgi:hypothetical protein
VFSNSVETTASREDVWRVWADVSRWPEWNADLERAELAGSFAVGSRITMTPQEGDPIELTVADAVEPGVFVDEARLGETVKGVKTRIQHRNRVLTPFTSSACPSLRLPRYGWSRSR